MSELPRDELGDDTLGVGTACPPARGARQRAVGLPYASRLPGPDALT